MIIFLNIYVIDFKGNVGFLPDHSVTKWIDYPNIYTYICIYYVKPIVHTNTRHTHISSVL